MRQIPDASQPKGAVAAGEQDDVAQATASKVARVLLVAIAVVVVASLATRYAAHLLEGRAPDSTVTAAMLAVRELFDVSNEANVPTWFASGLLLGCALLTAGVAALVRQAGGRYVPHWAGLALVLAFLSLDEVAVLHERLNTPMDAALGESGRGALRFAWVVPALVVVAAVGLAFLRFATHLPPRPRALLWTAAALFVTGAVGMEMTGGIALDTLEAGTLYTLLTTVEETLELLGALALLCGLLCLVRLEPTGAGYRLRLHPTLAGRSAPEG